MVDQPAIVLLALVRLPGEAQAVRIFIVETNVPFLVGNVAGA
jgi:hypothetical protein